MRVSDVGEFGLIARLARVIGVEFPPAADKGRQAFLADLGDDALVTSPVAGGLILTTDTMVEGVHFLPGKTAWEDVGWKALASNVSDIAAMGGRPHVALVTLALPPETLVEDMEALYRGLARCADEYGVILGGGDVVRAPAFSVTVALTGWATDGPDGQLAVLKRSAARPGDVVAVTGTLGDANGGLALLKEGRGAGDGATLLQAHLRPRPRLDAGQAAVRAGVCCGMDVSDGLLQDLGHIARASGVAVEVREQDIPVSEALRRLFPGQALEFALAGGEDYELLLVAAADAIGRAKATAGCPLTAIGEVKAGPPTVRVVDAAGGEVRRSRAGWDHFGESG